MEYNAYCNLYKTLYMRLVALASAAGIDEEGLKKYFIPEGVLNNENILLCLCSSLQNSGMMHNSIKFRDKYSDNGDIIRKVLFDYDIKKSANNYSSWEQLYAAMIEAGVTDNGTKMKKESNWQKYCRGIFDGLQFFTNNNGEHRIKLLVSGENLTEDKLKEITNISKEIHGLGFALTCDWLKECGCTWLAKPDVHIVEVLKYMNKTEKISNIDVLKYMYSWSEIVKENGDDSVTAYKLDKIIWLLCTNNFYLDERATGREAIYRIIDDI